MVRLTIISAALAVLTGSAGLCPNGCYSPSSRSSSSSATTSSSGYSSSSSSSSSSTEKSYVRTDRNGNETIIFKKPNETTIVNDRGVTIIQPDPDGTRTVVSPAGVRVTPPGPGRRRH
ncbi:MAG: hypothetical protein EXQ85_00450 [Alphaproteobacteria bacterium]|nr:hypothetical protein [Alphaproteobacteria bacterium]